MTAPSEAAPSARHVAVVPLGALDHSAQRALEFAGTLAPHVVAVHVRAANTAPDPEFDVRWSRGEPLVPLLVIDDPRHDWKPAFVMALDALRSTLDADVITVVVQPTQQDAFRRALAHTPGVLIRNLPG